MYTDLSKSLRLEVRNSLRSLCDEVESLVGRFHLDFSYSQSLGVVTPCMQREFGDGELGEEGRGVHVA